MGTQIQNMGMQISNINQFFGNQMQNMGCQINNLGMKIFNIGMTIQNNMQMFMMQQIQNNIPNQMINNLNNYINMNQIFRNQNMEMKNIQTFNFLNSDQIFKNGNMEINNNIDINSNKHYINILIRTTTGLKVNIVCNYDSTLEEFLKQFQKKFLIGDNELDKIHFICNATQLNLKDKNKKLGDLFTNMMTLTVIDMNHMVCRPIGGVIKLNVHSKEYILKIKCLMNIYEFLGRYFQKVGKNKENKKLEFLKEVTVEDFFKQICDSIIEDKSEDKHEFNCH
jgi:hypothetical protein